jgi:hypothetical protein
MPKAGIKKRSQAAVRKPAVRFGDSGFDDAPIVGDGVVGNGTESVSEVPSMRREAVSVLEQVIVSILTIPSQGLTDLPLEVLVVIARFIAGNNDYGTLLSLCLTCKVVKDELKSTFFETVLQPDINYLQRPRSGKGVRMDEYRHTKYVRLAWIGDLS